LRKGATWDNGTGWDGGTIQHGLWAGCYPVDEGHVYMDGGTFRVQNGGWEIARGDDGYDSTWSPGRGYAYLRGGIVDVNGFVTVRSMRPCVLAGNCDAYILLDNYGSHTPGKGGIDINSTASAIIITGEQGVKKRLSDTEGTSQTIIEQFNDYIAAGFVTAWGRNPDGTTAGGSNPLLVATKWPKTSDPKAEIQMDYDIVNPGRTTITAYLAKPYEANKPSSSTPEPKTRHHADKVDLHPILTWSPAVSMPAYTTGPKGKGHHVFFNTDKANVYPPTGFGTKWVLGTALGHYRTTTTSFDPYSCIIDNAGTLGKVPYGDLTNNKLALGTTYYWVVMEVNSVNDNGYPVNMAGINAGRGQVWQFRTISGKASNLTPKNNATVEVAPIAAGGSVSVTLRWTSGVFTRQTGPGHNKTGGHDVYMGTDPGSVTKATATVDPNNVYKGRTSSDFGVQATYLGTNLRLDKPTYWRIDEINDANFPLTKMWKGDTLKFTIPNYVLIDDFSTYGTTADLNKKWKSGHGGYVASYRCTLNNGSTIALSSGTMQYAYDNTVGSSLYSEVAYTFDGAGVDFNTGAQGTAALSMTYKGAVGNSTNPTYDRMYVILRDSNTDGDTPIVNHWDPNAAKNTTTTSFWPQWNIDIDDFTGANLSTVKRLLLGFGVPRHSSGTKGGTGVVYFDNFRIYQPRCVGLYAYRTLPGDLLLSTAYPPISDCKVDIKDLRLLTEQVQSGKVHPADISKAPSSRNGGDWVKSDHWTDAVPANDPCDSSLIAYWKCSILPTDANTQTVTDYSGNGRHGTRGRLPTAYDNNDPNWVKDNDSNHPHKGYKVLDFNDKEYVMCGGGTTWSHLANSDFTLCTWMKLKARTAAGWECFVAKGERAWKLQMLVAGQLIHFATPRNGNGGNRTIYAGPDKWYHVAGVWHAETDQLKAYIYVNGLLDNAVVTSVSPAQESDCDVILGAKVNESIWSLNKVEDRNYYYANCPSDSNSSGPMNHFLNGRLDDVRIYNRALTEGEIMRLAKATNPLFVTGYKRHYNSPSSSSVAFDGRRAADLQWPFPPDGKVDFKDFAIMADDWLQTANWPYRPLP